jgi:hypothetical protein
MEQKNLTVQEWIQIEKILDNGIIKLKNNKYIKIIKIIPINFNLKSDFEKESILNSYKIFLKTCNFNIQILIQSNKQDLQKNINNIQNNLKNENKEFLNNIGNNYIEFINKINSLKTSATKDFYIIISNQKTSENNIEEFICEELNDNFFKIKECLLRCGNSIKNINNKNEAEKILFSFFNSRIFNL